MFNKKGQVSETMTWVVATVAIIVILTLSVFIVQWGFKKKSFDVQSGTSDLLVTKSFMGYLLSDDGKGQQIWGQVKDKKIFPTPDVVSVDKAFIKNVFLNLYKEKYNSNQILLRIESEWCGWDPIIKASPGACDTSITLSNSGGLVPDKRNTKMFYDRIKLKDEGAKDKNTILELFLN